MLRPWTYLLPLGILEPALGRLAGSSTTFGAKSLPVEAIQVGDGMWLVYSRELRDARRMERAIMRSAHKDRKIAQLRKRLAKLEGDGNA